MLSTGITRGASMAIADLLDTCCEVKPGDEVVIASHVDGTQGGVNLVDEQAVAWIQEAVIARGANPTVLWFDEPDHPHHWRVPPVFLAAERACDVFINNSFDLTIEELKIVQETATEYGVTLCRNYGTTVGLLNSPWLQTPYELVKEIRYEAAKVFGTGGMPFVIDDPLGTHLEGTILPPNHPRFPTYTRYRADGPGYRPFPEWVFPPINIGGTNGVLVFDRMLSWWSRYIGISPWFKHPIELTIKDGRIVKIAGKEEADALRSYLKALEPQTGEDTYNFPEVHCGVHPCPVVAPQQCSHALVNRIVEHSGSNCIHFHIGAPWPRTSYPYWMHITADIVNATWKVGDNYSHKDGRMTVLDDPRIRAVADKYPGRPGLDFISKVF